MTAAAKGILEGALARPLENREELLAALSTSLEPVELSPEWQLEVAGNRTDVAICRSVALQTA